MPRQPAKLTRPRGFTLLEMLVSVTLVLLIMILMAEVFSMASNTVSKQQGTAENDQQARTFTTIIRSDLERMTMLEVYPFFPRSSGEEDDLEHRRGYFYYAENDAGNQTDDALAFTIDTFTNTTSNSDTSPMQGRALVLVDPAAGVDLTDPVALKNYLFANPNQPEGDDGVLDGSGSFTGSLNGIGVSRAAEVAYFLRGSNLYRRVLLLRDPYDPRGTTEFTPPFIDEDYPGAGAGQYAPTSGVVNGNVMGTGEFWRDFDYSAYYYLDYDSGTMSPVFHGPRFHSIQSLDNNRSNITRQNLLSQNVGLLQVPLSLSTPHRRFGHNYRDDFFGRPKEFIRSLAGTVEDANFNGVLDNGEDSNGNNTLDDEFIGRFTAQETAHSAFGYPGRFTNPFGSNALNLNPDTFAVQNYGNELSRRGEDLLITNVVEFDVKLWDDGLPTPKFVDLGHSETDSAGNPAGFYHRDRNISTEDVNLNGALDPGEDLNGNGQIDLFYGNRYDTWYPLTIQNSAGDDLTALGLPHLQRPPYRPYSPGEDGLPGRAGVDDDGNGVTDYYDVNGNGSYDPGIDILDVNEFGYPGTDDIPYPLKAIQLTIRFVDPSSKLIRQVTIVHSLVHGQH